jgi:hypothetical protein
VSPGHLGFPYFGGFIITTNTGTNTTFQATGAAATTVAQEFGNGGADQEQNDYLAGGFLCGMYGWTMGSWEVLTAMDATAETTYGKQDNSLETGIERSYGLVDLDPTYYGASW